MGVSNSLAIQKRLSQIHSLGRKRSGTLLFKSLQTQPDQQVQRAKLRPINIYDRETGLPEPTPKPTLPEKRMTSPHLLALENQFAADFEDTANPPDTQIGVGTNYIVEANNSRLTIWPKLFSSQSLTPQIQVPLSSAEGGVGLFVVPAGYVAADPWVSFDTTSRRWIVSALIFNQATDDSWIDLAYSTADDPLLPWTVRKLGSANRPNILRDQPKIGITDDKVIIAWNEYRFADAPPGSTENVPIGGNWVAFSKQELFDSASQLRGEGQNKPDPCLREPIPARNQSPGADGYVVSMARPEQGVTCNGLVPAASPDTGNVVSVVAISGEPGSLVITKTIVQVAQYSAPADVEQVGSQSNLAGGDTRVQSAIWEHGRLFLASNDACMVSLGCFRFLQIATNPAKLVQDFDVGLQDRALLYPSLAIDSRGDIIAVVSQVASGVLGAAVFDRLAGHSDWGLLTFKTGKKPIQCGEVTRIGDYSSADRDPSSPNEIWIAVETPPERDTVIDEVHWCPQSSVIGRFTIK